MVPQRHREGRKMRAKHWAFLILAIAGALFIFHNYTSHGGVAGVKSGLGLGGMG